MASDNAATRDASATLTVANKPVLNVRETAQELGVHENTVRNLERKGQLKAIRLPGSGFRRFKREDVERMQAEMFREFAPDTEAPPQRPDMPERVLDDEDYA